LPLLGISSSEFANSAMGRDILHSHRGFSFNSTGDCFGDTLGTNAASYAKTSLLVSDKIVTKSYFGKKNISK